MGHQDKYKLTALDTIWCESVDGGLSKWTSSGHLRSCSIADTCAVCMSCVLLLFANIMSYQHLAIYILTSSVVDLGHGKILYRECLFTMLFDVSAFID
eukprot:scaffold15349_cov125-Skeletonema_marinoi.AAC.2